MVHVFTAGRLVIIRSVLLRRVHVNLDLFARGGRQLLEHLGLYLQVEYRVVLPDLFAFADVVFGENADTMDATLVDVRADYHHTRPFACSLRLPLSNAKRTTPTKPGQPGDKLPAASAASGRRDGNG